MKNKNTIYVLDAYATIYRSYFAFVSKPLTNSKGENVSAIFGFFKTLHSILSEYKPEYFVIALDSITPTFRHQLFKEYKATRNKTPDDLHSQIPIIEKILAEINLPFIRKNGFEADDIIASIAAKAEKENFNCVIISGDKDLMQLIDENTFMLKPGKIKDWDKVTSEEVKNEWGVEPNRMLDLLSLIGDTADNIPGVKGIGIKTASRLLSEYSSLDEIFANTNKQKGALKTKLETGKDSAYFSRQLIQLKNDIELEDSVKKYSTENLNLSSAEKLFLQEEIFSMAKLYSKNISVKDKELVTPIKNSLFSDSNEVLLSQDKSINTPINIKQNTGNYKCIFDFKELDDIIDKAVQQGFAAYDCETESLNIMNTEITGFSISLKKGEAFYIPLKNVQPELYSEANDLIPLDKAKQAIEKLFSSKIKIAMHNGKFDMQIAASVLGLKEFNFILFDTMIAAWLLQPDGNVYGLDKLAERILGLKTVKFEDIVEKGKSFSSVPLKDAAFYASEDADITLQLYNYFEPQLKEHNLEKLFYNLEMPITFILSKMELAGIYLKREQLINYSEDLKDEIFNCENEIYKFAGKEFNIASNKQLQEILFVDRKLKPIKKTKTGFSTDTSVLEILALDDPVPQKILDYRALTKLKSTYTDTLPYMTDSAGRIHTSFIQTGTATGRLSSREPNLQNIPIRGNEGKKIRSAFQSEPGNILISADYAQIELVILAHLSKDKNLMEAFNLGIDVHAKTASLIFEVDIDKVTSDMRRIAKTINFGIMYGMSAFRLSSSLHITRTQASEFIQAYFKTYSSVKEFMQTICDEAEKNGYVQTIMGRKRYIPNINSKNKTEKAAAERIAINTPIQGSAADIVKKAMIDVHNVLISENLNAKILLQVHDELILECKSGEVDIIKNIIKDKMEHAVELSVPLRVSIESGKSWGDFH